MQSTSSCDPPQGSAGAGSGPSPGQGSRMCAASFGRRSVGTTPRPRWAGKTRTAGRRQLPTGRPSPARPAARLRAARNTPAEAARDWAHRPGSGPARVGCLACTRGGHPRCPLRACPASARRAVSPAGPNAGPAARRQNSAAWRPRRSRSLTPSPCARLLSVTAGGARFRLTAAAGARAQQRSPR